MAKVKFSRSAEKCRWRVYAPCATNSLVYSNSFYYIFPNNILRAYFELWKTAKFCEWILKCMPVFVPSKYRRGPKLEWKNNCATNFPSNVFSTLPSCLVLYIKSVKHPQVLFINGDWSRKNASKLFPYHNFLNNTEDSKITCSFLPTKIFGVF